MTTMFSEIVTRGSYNARSSIAAGRIGVVTMPDVTAIVFVVDDDISVRESLELLIKHAGWQPETFASARISCPARAPRPCCLVLDVTLPGSTARLQQQLAGRTTCRSSSSPGTATCR
jgi:hypothetical protein